MVIPDDELDVTSLELAQEIIEEFVYQTCSYEGGFDSMAISTYADGIRYLAKLGKLEIISEYGRRVIAKEIKP